LFRFQHLSSAGGVERRYGAIPTRISNIDDADFWGDSPLSCELTDQLSKLLPRVRPAADLA
jgi:hypothetical protein